MVRLIHPLMEGQALKNSESVLKVLSAASFLIFFNSYLFAPLVPSLAKELGTTENMIGLVVPAYLLPYGISTLFYGPLSDRIGRKNIILSLLGFAIVTTLLSAFVQSAEQLIALRMLAGLCAGGIIPIGLALVGDLFPFEMRGRAMGWIFGAIAGGAAFGSTLGAALNPVIGWRVELVLLTAASALVFFFAYRYRQTFVSTQSSDGEAFWKSFAGYLDLLKNKRAARTYLFIFLNGIFHSGVFSWLGLYFSRRYHLGDFGIGLALLGYGLPGMFLGPLLGRIADRRGRSGIVPAGFIVGACCALALILPLPVFVAGIIVTLLSVGFDMTHPLLVGIVSTLSTTRRGLAMGFNAFVLFTGFGLGALIFQWLLAQDFTFALCTFGAFELFLGVLGARVFAQE